MGPDLITTGNIEFSDGYHGGKDAAAGFYKLVCGIRISLRSKGNNTKTLTYGRKYTLIIYYKIASLFF